MPISLVMPVASVRALVISIALGRKGVERASIALVMSIAFWRVEV